MSPNVSVWLPSCVDPYTLNGNGELKFKIAWAISQAVLSQPDKRGYISINSKKWESLLGWKAWRDAKNALSELGSFKKNKSGRESYQPGIASKQWLQSPAIKSQQILRHDLLMPKFVKKLKSHRATAAASRESEYTEIQRYIADTIAQGITLAPSWRDALDKLRPDPEVKNESYRQACVERAAMDIVNGDFTAVKVGTTGRHTSCITSLSSHVRPYLKLFGEDVVEIDLSSSQPYFMAGCLWKNPDMRDAVQDGSFYERINERLPEPYDMNKERKTFKQVFMAVTYANPDKAGGKDYTLDPDYKHADFMEAMDSAYYGFSDFTRQYRLTHGNTALVNKLQRIESDVFIQKVVKSFIGKVPVIPIHDAVLCRRSDKEQVSDKLERELFKRTGLKPMLGRD